MLFPAPVTWGEAHDSHVDRTSWPVKFYVAALLFAFVSLAICTSALDGQAMNAGRSLAQLAICGVLALRLAWALHCREQSKMWIAYVVGMFMAVPIWLVVEPIVLSFARE